MIYWKVRFDDGSGKEGWLVFNDEMIAQKLTDEDGKEITVGISYTTIDTEAEPPGWA